MTFMSFSVSFSVQEKCLSLFSDKKDDFQSETVSLRSLGAKPINVGGSFFSCRKFRSKTSVGNDMYHTHKRGEDTPEILKIFRMEETERSIQERLSLVHYGQSQNILRYLIHRDFGSCAVHKSRMQIDFVAETILVLKSHKKLKYNLPGIPKATFLMVSSPDGTKMASTHGNHNIYITEVTTGKHIRTLVGHPRTPWCIAFHPSSSQILASGCLGGQVRVWDINDGCTIWETENVIASLAFHPTERLLVIATCNKIYFWDWTAAKPYDVASTRTEYQKVRYVAFDNLGKKLVTGIANTRDMRRRRTIKNEEKYRECTDVQHLLLSACIDQIARMGQQRSNILFQNRSANGLNNQNTEFRNQSLNSNSEPLFSGVETSRSSTNFRRFESSNEDMPDDYVSVSRPNPHVVHSYRVQAWDFSNGETPDIADYEENIVVQNCNIRNDATIDISSDGKLLTAMTPVPRCDTTTIAVYSLQWETLGEKIYSTDIACESAVSVSFSPTQQHLLVGVARNCNSSDANYMAHIYRLIDREERSEKHVSYRYIDPLYVCDKNLQLSDNRRFIMERIQQLLHSMIEPRDSSLNCIRWLPQPGQGLIYATNTGELNIVY